jgi:hypothetical protein
MYTLQFKEFLNPDKFPHDNITLYILRDGKKVLYVGISKANVWNRWFGSFGRMHKNIYGEWITSDSISIHIVGNMPKSLDFEIDLWTLDESIIFLGSKSGDLESVENEMIVALLPQFNYVGNFHNGVHEGYKITEYLQYTKDHQSKIKNRANIFRAVPEDTSETLIEDDIPF